MVVALAIVVAVILFFLNQHPAIVHLEKTPYVLTMYVLFIEGENHTVASDPHLR